ncbi:MAG: acetolactate synthase small subunit [Lachnospiraceae bacterium]|nr:acetolactate synthase small subunit [Lachnospiraceae bacterium]
MKRRVFSLLVENRAGVLGRVSGMFSRRGYNIDSLTVGVTENPEFSRMTVVAYGDELTLDQIEKQLLKLEDVITVDILRSGSSVCRELILIKVKANREEKQQIISLVDVFRANIVDVAPDSLMIEITGNAGKIESFIKLMDGFEIESLVRTGITGLPRGKFEEE